MKQTEVTDEVGVGVVVVVVVVALTAVVLERCCALHRKSEHAVWWGGRV